MRAITQMKKKNFKSRLDKFRKIGKSVFIF